MKSGSSASLRESERCLVDMLCDRELVREAGRDREPECAERAKETVLERGWRFLDVNGAGSGSSLSSVMIIVGEAGALIDILPDTVREKCSSTSHHHHSLCARLSMSAHFYNQHPPTSE